MYVCSIYVVWIQQSLHIGVPTSKPVKPVGSFMHQSESMLKEYTESLGKLSKEEIANTNRKSSKPYAFTVYHTSRRSVYW